MAALPGTDWTVGRDTPANAIGTLRHVFTHFSLDLAIVPCTEPEGEGWWQRIDRLDEAGLPTLYRRAGELVIRAREAA